MHNVWQVYKRDVKRLFKAPAAMVVVVALILLPSLYTWFNVAGFFNPYDNTGNLRVCVVNQDVGASSDVIGNLNLGEQITEQLHDNNQLGWEFTDYDTAMDEVHSGKAYAAFVIPQNFSEDFTTLLTGDVSQPQLQYYVNEKAGAVSPKITDTGATTLDQTINSEFVSTASSVIAEKIDSSVSGTQGAIDTSKSGIALQFVRAKTAADDARGAIAGLNDATRQALQKTDDARSSLCQARQGAQTLSGQLQTIADSTLEAQNKLSSYTAALIPVLDESSLYASQAAAKTNESIGKASGNVISAQADVNAAITSGRAAADQCDTIIAQLILVQQGLPDSDPTKAILAQVCDNLTSQNDSVRQSLDQMESISKKTESTANSISAASDAVNTSVQGTLSSAAEYRSVLSSTTLPAVNSGLAQIGGSAGNLATAVSNQTLLIDQATLALDQLTTTLNTTSTALTQTDELLASLESGLDAAQTDLVSLGTSNALMDLIGQDSIDAGKVAGFMLSPTQVRTENLYSLNAYGSAMAPLFTNLTLWIGVFMLMVILKQEVDSEGIPNLKPKQSYMARWLFLAPLVALQAIICCVGNLIIGVQTVNMALYLLTAVMASLAYLSIQYALSVTLQHIGKGICIVLVFMQIPGATGLYPIEMTPDFFQSTYPLFPFTYGISAMRETIAGFYGSQWGVCIAMLLGYMIVAFVLGLIIRPYLTNLNRMFARQIRESNILNSEDVQLPPRRYRLAQMMRVMYDKAEFREAIDNRADTFMAWYPRLKHIAWLVGIAAPLALTPILMVLGVEKVIILTMWLGWLVLIMLISVALEHVHNNVERQAQLGDMPEDELREIFMERDGVALQPAAAGQGDNE